MLSASNVHQVGCGGIGGFLLLNLIKTLPEGSSLHIWDGDRIEEGNIDRQMFRSRDVGRPKVQPMSGIQAKCKIIPHFEFVNPNTVMDPGPIFCCVDNHPARLSCIKKADEINSACIIAANEFSESEAYYYSSSWSESPLDPRRYYKEIVTDKSNDPLHPCTGDDHSPQLATANLGAAFFASWLHRFWTEEFEALEDDELCPVRLSSNRFMVMTTRKGAMREHTSTVESAA